ncbi:MAG: hypothetical protein ACRC6T_11740 [Sarcina sp.]|jgi:hypothetical protein|uniref:hypothetical protein n=1 Tax=uncultured Clostridium sp. TaxID=59620 RepID=UPI00260D420B|nr:hypothetical protein [uncultured Clostridium sp.]
MIINSDLLITKIDAKQKKDSTEKYLMVSMLDLVAGDLFEIIEKDIEVMMKLTPMKKYNIDLKLTSGKYGLKLEIAAINKEIGAI